MKKNSYLKFIFFIIIFLTWGEVRGQVTQYTNASLTASTVATNSTASTLSLNTGSFSSLCSQSQTRTSGGLFNSATPTNYFQFTSKPNSGYQLDVTSISIGLRRTGSGPTNGIFRYSLDGGTTFTTSPTTYTITDPGSCTPANYTWTVSFSALSSTNGVIIRFFPYSTGAAGNLDWFTFSLNGTVSLSATFTSTLSTGAGVEPSSFSSLINTQASSILNFDFTFTDDGTTPATDNTDTQISQIVFSQGIGNNITNWTQAIQGVELSDGTNSTTTATINGTNITFTSLPNSTGQIGRIIDNATKTYTLKVWLKSTLGGTLPNIIDGLNFVFEVNNSSFTFVTGGLAVSQSVNSGSTNNAIDVVATQLSFVQQPSNALVNNTMSPNVSVQATDINGNRDLGFNNNISITSTGTLDSSPQITTATNGLSSFTIFHTNIGTSLTLNATALGLSNVNSNSFDIYNIGGFLLNPGDLAIIGFDAQETGSGTEDGVYIMNMVDIPIGTTFSYVNSRFEACAAANTRTMRWGGSGDQPYEDPGIVTFTWNGSSNIAKGSVIKMRAETSVASIIVEINGVVNTSNFTITNPSTAFPNISSSSSDQMYLVQGTFTAYGTVNVDRYNLFNGRVLFGFTNGASWVPFTSSVSCNTNGTGRESRLHPDLRCFNIENTTREDAMYYKTTATLQQGTKRELLGKIKDETNNWVKGVSSIPTARKTTTFTINAGKPDGTWVGDISTNWFDCANWEGLSVPNQTTDVIVENYSPYNNNANIDITSPFANEFQNIADCKNLTITSRKVILENGINNRLDVRGNINISGTGQIDMNDSNNTTTDGTINLYGNFTNQLTNGLDEGNGTFNFVGTNEQTIQNTNGNESLYRLNVNKTTSDVKLLSNINLTSYSSTNNGQITLTQNDINLNGNNIDLGSFGILNENLNSNHLVKDNTATFDKGTGSGISGGYVRTSSKSITTSNNTMAGIGLHLLRTAGSDYSVEVDRYHYSGYNNTRTIKRVFHIKTTTGTETGTNSTLKMFFASDELNGLNNGSDGTLTAWRLPTGSPNAWEYHPNSSVIHTATARSVEANNVNTFSHWAMTAPNIILSSCLFNFNAERIEKNIAKLSWKIFLQENPKKFELQKSIDGVNFMTIATIEAGNQNTNYFSIDQYLLQSSYYRLKIYKNQNEIEISPLRLIVLENEFLIYPNPVKDILFIEGNNITDCQIKLTEVSGKIIFSDKGTLSEITQQLNEKIPNLAKGMYFIEIFADKQRFVHKLIKE